jgi:multiple sugar transport system substrate-binding protein
MKRVFALLTAALLTAAACTAGSEEVTPETIDTEASHAPVTISFWHGWSVPHEVKSLDQIVSRFEEQYPWITVKTTPGVDDDTKIVAAINGGNPPDAVSSFRPDSVGQYCSTGAFIDLQPFIDESQVDMSVFPASALSYTHHDDKQCALPFLTDTFGLYYNKDLLAKAGFDSPPQTLDELTEVAKATTEFNPDGSIKVAGFVPLMGWYENDVSRYATSYGAEYFDESGNSSIASDPAWTELFEWQKELIDFYGYENIQRFAAGAGEEFSPQNVFEQGKVAMLLDGEWRTAFIPGEAPDLNYDTAPFPYAVGHEDQAEVAVVGGTVLGVPRGSEHPNEAWLLLNYLATNTEALVQFANEIHNVPTTTESLESPDLDLGDTFDTFLTVFENPKSAFPPATDSGLQYNDLVNAFAEKWQAGKVDDLDQALKDLDDNIDAQMQQA